MSEIRGIRYANVLEFFCARVPGAADVRALEFELIGDGRSNITYRVSAGERSWVLRRPPLGHVLPTAHDMAREFRVIGPRPLVGRPSISSGPLLRQYSSSS